MAPPNPLAECGLPRFFALPAPVATGLPEPQARIGVAVRLFGRSLAGMQKEAIVVSSAGVAWRLASDEGAYLNGLDEAPCPLAFMTTGMAASFMRAIQTRLATAGVPHRGIRLVQDNYYTMQGSMPRRTMIGGALPVDLEVEITTDRRAEDLGALVEDAVERSPVVALLRPVLRNRFTLTVNGRDVGPGTSPAFDGPPQPDPRRLFEEIVSASPSDLTLVARDGMTPLTEEATSHEGSSYAPEQHRRLHLRGICTVRPDGLYAIEQHLYNPRGSIFHLLADETRPGGAGGRGAPDAASYISAGIGFCFMTQFGRFAAIVGKQLDGYRIVQDSHFATGRPEPVDTHVHLDTPDGDAFARDVVDMGERTCFLHALCRTPLSTNVRVVTRRSHIGPA